jgi:RNA polymerase sigma-70 factor (ECF subfamily)
MTAHEPDTNDLLRQAGAGDRDARHQLLARHRDRLRKMIAWRLDRRLAPRVDPSDVVQDLLVEADGKLDQFLQDRPLPFYPWLRTLAWDHLAKQYRRHLKARGRSVLREEPSILNLPDESAAELANRLVTSATSPSQQAIRREVRERVRKALAALSERDREVLILRHLEQLSVLETAEILNIKPGAVKVRHLRALERIRKLLPSSGEVDHE